MRWSKFGFLPFAVLEDRATQKERVDQVLTAWDQLLQRLRSDLPGWKLQLVDQGLASWSKQAPGRLSGLRKFCGPGCLGDSVSQESALG